MNLGARLGVKLAARHAMRKGFLSREGHEKFLSAWGNDDFQQTLTDGLIAQGVTAGVVGVGADGAIVDSLLEFLRYLLENPEIVAAFIQMILALFGI